MEDKVYITFKVFDPFEKIVCALSTRAIEKREEIHAAFDTRKNNLIQYLHILGKRPHTVSKERDGKLLEVEEFFITDLVELMNKDGLKIGYVIAGDEDEVMGIDDLPSLIKAQGIFKRGLSGPCHFNR